MHTTHSNTQYKNESSTVKWAQWDKTQSRELLVCSYVCASNCAQFVHTILHRTDLIVFPLTLQTITTAQMMSIWGKGGWKRWRTRLAVVINSRKYLFTNLTISCCYKLKKTVFAITFFLWFTIGVQLVCGCCLVMNIQQSVNTVLIL